MTAIPPWGTPTALGPHHRRMVRAGHASRRAGIHRRRRADPSRSSTCLGHPDWRSDVGAVRRGAPAVRHRCAESARGPAQPVRRTSARMLPWRHAATTLVALVRAGDSGPVLDTCLRRLVEVNRDDGADPARDRPALGRGRYIVDLLVAGTGFGESSLDRTAMSDAARLRGASRPWTSLRLGTAIPRPRPPSACPPRAGCTRRGLGHQPDAEVSRPRRSVIGTSVVGPRVACADAA